MAGNAGGFCVYNDPAIAIAWLLGQGAERIAYVDVDARHGDGVERAFWDDPRVLTIGLQSTRGCGGSEFASFDDGYNPADPVDQAIMATGKAVFPPHGLMP